MSHLVLKFIILFKCLSDFHAVTATDELWEACLSDLSLNELIRLDKSLEYVPNDLGYTVVEDRTQEQQEIQKKQQNEKPTARTTDNGTKEAELAEPKPTALAMTAEKREYSHHHSTSSHPPWAAMEKPSKLQTLFQISITALSFLSFGGYLLCLIVQAIKSKGSTYLYPMTGASLNGNIKRIRVYRRNPTT